jgi:hypothetical protein
MEIERRDYFAGQALAGLLAGKHARMADDPKVAAKLAYGYADAMLIADKLAEKEIADAVQAALKQLKEEKIA